MKPESIYYSYKNKSNIYYLTASEEEKLIDKKNMLIQSLSNEQLKLFSELEKQYYRYKDSLIKEIIDYTISFNE